MPDLLEKYFSQCISANAFKMHWCRTLNIFNTEEHSNKSYPAQATWETILPLTEYICILEIKLFSHTQKQEVQGPWRSA